MHVGIVTFFADVDQPLDLANGLQQAGAKVTLYLSRARVANAVDDVAQPEQTLYRRGVLGPQVKVRLFQTRRMRDPRSMGVVKQIVQAIYADGVDVVYLISGNEIWMAVLANLLKDVAVVTNLAVPQPNVGEFPPASVAIAINRLLVRGSDFIIVNGYAHVELVEQMYGIGAERVWHVPLGPSHAFARWATTTVPEEPGNVLFFGRVSRYKGLEFLVRAQPALSKRVPYARIVIAGQGQGKEMGRCLQLIQDPSRFEIHSGFQRGDAAATFMQRAAVIALPYLTSAASGILMSAYVFGKPVVATQVGILSEYVQDGTTGLLVPPANVDELADALSRLLLDDDLRHQMGQNALNWIKGDLSWRNIAAKYLEVYDRAIFSFTRKGRKRP